MTPAYECNPESASQRQSVYWLLIVAAGATMAAHVLTVQSADRKTPFLSANDRSRWATIRAVVDEGTYAIDNIDSDRSWRTIDKVRHIGPDGQPHYYSSKPPLLPTLWAGQYWILQQLTGATLAHQPFYVGRWLLILNNVLPMCVYLALLSHLIERWGTTDWGRYYTMGAACFGTFLTPFSVTLNNHLPAAIGALVTVYASLRVWHDPSRAFGWSLLCGLGAGFVAINEFPAVSLLALLTAIMLWRAPRVTAIAFIPAALLVGAALLVTNYYVHGDWRPPYAHADWYNYPGSYWDGREQGVDRGEPSIARYALHVLIGHHGIFSLTPIWCLSLWGIYLAWQRRGHDRCAQYLCHWGVMTAILMVVCVTFYLLRSLEQRNYGGVSSGFRWMFWFTPLLTILLLPAADRLAPRRWGRRVSAGLLAISVLSACYGYRNPWVHPWPYEYAKALGWVER